MRIGIAIFIISGAYILIDPLLCWIMKRMPVKLRIIVPISVLLIPIGFLIFIAYMLYIEPGVSFLIPFIFIIFIILAMKSTITIQNYIQIKKEEVAEREEK